MAGEIVGTAELLDYLGADEREAELVASLRAYAVEKLGQAPPELTQTYNEAVRVQVWISYVAVRDTAGNLEFLREYLDELVAELREGAGA